MLRSFLMLSLLAGPGRLASAQFPGPPEGPPYGRACGFVGVDPEPRTAIETLIHYKDTTGIFSWLHDTSAVYQAYGAEAVIRLQRGGMSIPARELDLVDALRRSRRMVHVCSGCTHWYMEVGQALLDNTSVNNIR